MSRPCVRETFSVFFFHLRSYDASASSTWYRGGGTIFFFFFLTSLRLCDLRSMHKTLFNQLRTSVPGRLPIRVFRGSNSSTRPYRYREPRDSKNYLCTVVPVPTTHTHVYDTRYPPRLLSRTKTTNVPTPVTRFTRD